MGYSSGLPLRGSTDKQFAFPSICPWNIVPTLTMTEWMHPVCIDAMAKCGYYDYCQIFLTHDWSVFAWPAISGT